VGKPVDHELLGSEQRRLGVGGVEEAPQDEPADGLADLRVHEVRCDGTVVESPAYSTTPGRRVDDADDQPRAVDDHH
jgi:hypothetical protein